MFRYNVEDGPSPYRPGFERERTIATVNRPTVRAPLPHTHFPTQFTTQDVGNGEIGPKRLKRGVAVLAPVYGLYWAFLKPIETAK